MMANVRLLSVGKYLLITDYLRTSLVGTLGGFLSNRGNGSETQKTYILLGSTTWVTEDQKILSRRGN